MGRKLSAVFENARFRAFISAALALLTAVLAGCKSPSPRVENPDAAIAIAPPAASLPVKPVAMGAKLSSESTVNGSVLLVTLHSPLKTDYTGEFEGTRFDFFPDQENEWQALVGIPHKHAPGPGVIRIYALAKENERPVVEIPFQIGDAHYKQEVLTVSAKMVNPPKKTMARIAREVKETQKIYSRETKSKLWHGSFAFPIQSVVTSPYGTRRMYNGEERNSHGGLDLKAAVGTKILAPQGGVVELAKNLYFTGNTVMIDHGYGLVSLYAHMSKILVKPGQKVSAGDLLGLSGATGRVSGPHLHWQVYVHRQKVNPLDLMKVLQ